MCCGVGNPFWGLEQEKSLGCSLVRFPQQQRLEAVPGLTIGTVREEG